VSSPRFLNATVEHFTDTGEWPTLRLLQQTLTQENDLADARKEAKRLRCGHGRRNDGKVVLSIAGILHADPTSPLLDDFEATLQIAARLYKKSPRWQEATISYRDLIARRSFSELQARRAIALLESEGLVAPGPPGDDTRVISPRIRHFLRARNIENYVEKKRWLDRRRHLRRLVAKPLGIFRWFGREDTTIGAKIAVGVLVFVIGSLLLAAIFWGIQQSSQSDGHANAPRRSAAARSGG
jgi:hypothetical protein